MALISAAITNLGKYNEGVLDFTWLDLPATASEFNSALEEVGIGEPDSFGIPYEEWFVSDYEDESDCDVARILGEYPSLKYMNKVAECIEELDGADRFALEDFCNEHDLDFYGYGLGDVFEADDDILEDLVKKNLEDRGVRGLFYFFGQCVKNPMADYFEIDAYGNMKPVEDYEEKLSETRKEILKAALAA